MKKKLLSTLCPCCGLAMRTAAMSCQTCQVKIEGDFSETAFSKLSPEDQRFLEEYLLAGFSIKQLEKNGVLGYAAIRSRLDRLITNYKLLVQMDGQKKVILEKLRTDEINASEAKNMLEKLTGE